MLGRRHTAVGAQIQPRKEEMEAEQPMRGEEYRGREGAGQGNGNAFEVLALHSGRYLNWWFGEDPDLPR